MSRSKIISETIFWGHSAIVIGWVAVFFVPTSLWQNKAMFHFIVTMAILAHQILWGFILRPRTGKLGLVCILTTAMHVAKGETIYTELNYTHRWADELCDRFGIRLSSAMADSIAVGGLAAVSIQYFLLQP